MPYCLIVYNQNSGHSIYKTVDNLYKLIYFIYSLLPIFAIFITTVIALAIVIMFSAFFTFFQPRFIILFLF